MDLAAKPAGTVNPSIAPLQSSESAPSVTSMNTVPDNISSGVATANVSTASGLTHAIFLTQQLPLNHQQPPQLSLRPNIVMSSSPTGIPNAIRINPNVRMVRMVQNVTSGVPIPNVSLQHFTAVSAPTTIKATAPISATLANSVTVNVNTSTRTTGCSILPKTSPNQVNSLVTTTATSTAPTAVATAPSRMLHQLTPGPSSSGAMGAAGSSTAKVPQQRVVSPIKIAPSVQSVSSSSSIPSSSSTSSTAPSGLGASSGSTPVNRRMIVTNVSSSTSTVPITSHTTLRPKMALPVNSAHQQQQPPVSVQPVSGATLATSTGGMNPVSTGSTITIATTNPTTQYVQLKRTPQPKVVNTVGSAASGNLVSSLPTMLLSHGTAPAPRLVMTNLATGTPTSGTLMPTARHLTVLPSSMGATALQARPPAHHTTNTPGTATLHFIPASSSALMTATTAAGALNATNHNTAAVGAAANLTSPNRKRPRKQDIRTGAAVTSAAGVASSSVPTTLVFPTTSTGEGAASVTVTNVSGGRNQNLFVPPLNSSTFYTVTATHQPQGALVPSTTLINLASASVPQQSIATSSARQVYSFSPQTAASGHHQLILKPAGGGGNGGGTLQSFTGQRSLQSQGGTAYVITSGGGTPVVSSGTGATSAAPPNYSAAAQAQTNVSAWLSTQNVDSGVYQRVVPTVGSNIAAQQGIAILQQLPSQPDSMMDPTSQPPVLLPFTASRPGKRGRKPNLVNALGGGVGSRAMLTVTPMHASPPQGDFSTALAMPTVKGRRGARQGSVTPRGGVMKRGETRGAAATSHVGMHAGGHVMSMPTGSLKRGGHVRQQHQQSALTSQFQEFSSGVGLDAAAAANLLEDFPSIMEARMKEEAAAGLLTMTASAREISPSPPPTPVKRRRLMRLIGQTRGSKFMDSITSTGLDPGDTHVSLPSSARRNHFESWNDFKQHEANLRKIDLPSMKNCMKYFESLGRRVGEVERQLNYVTEDVGSSKNSLELLLEKCKVLLHDEAVVTTGNAESCTMITDLLTTIENDSQQLHECSESIRRVAQQHHSKARTHLEKIKARRSCRRSPRGSL